MTRPDQSWLDAYTERSRSWRGKGTGGGRCQAEPHSRELLEAAARVGSSSAEKPKSANDSDARARIQSARGNKFGARRTAGPGGRVYDSAAEAAEARRLEDEKLTGGIVSWIPQVSIIVGHENGRNIRHVVDFMAIVSVDHKDKTFVGKLIEVKGMDTAAGRAKRGAMAALYGLEIEVVKKCPR